MPSKLNKRLEQQLSQFLQQMQLPLSAAVQEKLLAYITLLGKWNKAFNLTAIRDPEKMLTHHIMDSLAVLFCVKGPTVLDVGTGAGLPGIPLSLAKPDWQFVLLDSNQKKLRFVRQAVLELGLSNVELVHSRLETYPQTQNFATVISRAFAPFPKLMGQCLPFCSEPGQQLVAMLGAKPEQDLTPPIGMDYAILPVGVPGLNAQRHVLRLFRRN